MAKAWSHFKTITHHRTLVMLGCFRVGLVWQGLTHDLSKYSPTEFRAGARYFQGNRSPNAKEREEMGYSWPGCTTRAATATILNTGRIWI